VRLELTKRGDYAVRAMLALAGDGDGLLSARRIAAEMAIPPRFLPQVMGDLVRAALVEGVPGRSGGYRLSQPAANISLLTIVEAVEGDSRRTSCVLRGGPCRGEGACAVHATFIAAEEGMIAALQGMTLAEVADADMGRAEYPPADVAAAAS